MSPGLCSDLEELDHVCCDHTLPTTHLEEFRWEACLEWQWIARVEGECPSIKGWTTTTILETVDRPGPPPRRDGPHRTGDETGAPEHAQTGAGDETGERAKGIEAAQERKPVRYCGFTNHGRGEVATLWEETARLGIEKLQCDCMAVIPLATGMEESEAETRRWRERERVFLARAGRTTNPLGTTGLPTTVDPVPLVVIDTAPSRATSGVPPWLAPWNSPHGVGLANMAKRLTCLSNHEAAAGAGDGGDCAQVAVEAELALAYVHFDRFSAAGSVRDDLRGGYVGNFTDLAAAIDRAAASCAASGRCVLNLSVGWNGHLFGGWEATAAEMEPRVRMVFDAIADAVEGGALVVAAAGNLTWGPDAEVDLGPMLPAGWEVHTTDGTDEAPPLVHAVGGLSYESFAPSRGYRQLANARFKAKPRLLAFADHAVVERHRAEGHTATLTGTSVASLVVATAAAASWLYFPEKKAHEIMDEVYGSGRPISEPGLGESAADPRPDFWPGRRLATLLAPSDRQDEEGESAGPVHRVRLCRAVERACREVAAVAGAGQFDCPSCVLEDVPPPETDHAALDRFASAPRISLEGRQPQTPGEHPQCPPEATRRELTALAAVNARMRGAAPPAWEYAEIFYPGDDPGAAEYRCPHWQFPEVGSVAWIDPQPGSGLCSTCDFQPGSPATVFLEVDPLFRYRSLRWPVLLVGDRAYALDWDPDRDRRVIVEGVEYYDGETVVLTFVVDDRLSRASPLLRVD